MNELYESNSDFKEYVDRYCKTYRISVEEALEHELVKEYGRYCIENKEKVRT